MTITHTIRYLAIASILILFEGVASAQSSAGAGGFSRGAPKQCVDAALVAQAVLSIPPTGVCDKEYVLGKYDCRDFARDECLALRSKGIPSWKLGIKFDTTSPPAGPRRGDLRLFNPTFKCLLKTCLPGATCPADTCCLTPDKRAELLRCAEGKLTGHVVVLAEITDATAKRLGIHAFAVYEPQGELGPARVFCAWQQKSTYPDVPEDCRKVLTDGMKSAAGLECPDVSMQFPIFDCNAPLSGASPPIAGPKPIEPQK